MKIALLSFEYPPDTGFGGIGTYSWYHARALVKLGHEVHVLTAFTKPAPMQTTEHDGVMVHRYRSGGRLMNMFKSLKKRQLFWTRSRLENMLSMRRGFAMLREKHGIDLVEMPESGAEGTLINHFSGVPSVIRYHAPSALQMPYYDVRRADTFWCSLVEKVAMRGAKAMTSCSQFLADEVREKLKLRRPIEVIANGIDVDLFDQSEQINARERFQIPKDRLMIFFAGRLENRKGVHIMKEVAMAIAKELPVAFVFAGQDTYQIMKNDVLPYWESQQLKGSMHYLEKLDLEGVRSCLRQSDIFWIPSLWENCPYSCLEAMAAGRAIVSSDAGGLPELVQHEQNGLIAKTSDHDEFREALLRLIGDAELRERLGNAARQSVEDNYTDRHIADVSVRYYEQCFPKIAANSRATSR